MNSIKEFKQLYLLETYSGQSYILEAEKVNILDKLIEQSKFVKVSGARINVSNISSYYPIPMDDIYSLLLQVPNAARTVLLKIMKEYDVHDMPRITVKICLRRLRNHFQIPISERKDDTSGWSEKKLEDRRREFFASYLHKNYPNNA